MANKVKSKIKAIVKKKPIKAGHTAPKNVGGILNAKVITTVKQAKDG